MANDLVNFVNAQYDACLELLAKKNHDYAGQNGGADPLANFRMAEQLGVVDTERAVFVRLLDKVARLATLLDYAPEVADESFKDTARDLCNYTMILLYAWEEK